MAGDARSIAFGRGRDRGNGVVAAPFEGQQRAVNAGRPFPDRAHALFIARGPVVRPGDEQHGNINAGKPLGVPQTGVHAPGADGHGGPDPRIDKGLVRFAALPVDRQRIERRGRQRPFADAAAGCHDGAIAAHRIADQPCPVGVDQPRHARGLVRVQPRHFVQHEQLVQRPVHQRRTECRLRVISRIGMVDGGNHIALGCQILAQMGHEEAVAGVAVAHQDQRKGIGRIGGGGVAHGAAFQRDLGPAVADQAGETGVPRRSLRRRIPQFDRQRAVIARIFGRPGRGRVDAKNVDLIRVQQIEPAHPHGQVAITRQFGGIGRLPVDPVLREAGRGDRHDHHGCCQCEMFQLCPPFHAVRP